MARTPKKEVRFFVSYSTQDDEWADPFMTGLNEMLAPSKHYAFRCWRDTVILPGEKWLDEISRAMDECTLGLLLVSPAFLASRFITEEELPRFVGDGAKPVIPVMLKKVNLKRHDLKGLEESQLFRLKAGPKDYRSFAQCGSNQRQDFIYELHERIEERLDKLMG